jgi:hypothetical protein
MPGRGVSTSHWSSLLMAALDHFGGAYRQAVFERVTSTAGTRLAWALLDAAYAHKSPTVTLGYRLAGHIAGLPDVRSVRRARDDLEAAGLLTHTTTGTGRGARTEWTLTLPNGCGTAHDLTGAPPHTIQAEETSAGMSAGMSAEEHSRIRIRSSTPPKSPSNCPICGVRILHTTSLADHLANVHELDGADLLRHTLGA